MTPTERTTTMITTIPTPLTEDEILESPISSDEAGSQMVHAEFARQLERALVTEEECGVIKKQEIDRLNTMRRSLEQALERAVSTLVSVLESFGAPQETMQALKSGDAEHVCFWAKSQSMLLAEQQAEDAGRRAIRTAIERYRTEQTAGEEE